MKMEEGSVIYTRLQRDDFLSLRIDPKAREDNFVHDIIDMVAWLGVNVTPEKSK